MSVSQVPLDIRGGGTDTGGMTKTTIPLALDAVVEYEDPTGPGSYTVQIRIAGVTIFADNGYTMEPRRDFHVEQALESWADEMCSAARVANALGGVR